MENIALTLSSLLTGILTNINRSARRKKIDSDARRCFRLSHPTALQEVDSCREQERPQEGDDAQVTMNGKLFLK